MPSEYLKKTSMCQFLKIQNTTGFLATKSNKRPSYLYTVRYCHMNVNEQSSRSEIFMIFFFHIVKCIN